MAIAEHSGGGLTATESAYESVEGKPVTVKDYGERASWLQVTPLVLVLILFFGIPMLVVVAVSFFDYSRGDIIPAFMLDNYIELFRSDVTLRLYLSSVKFAAIVWAV